MVKTLTSLFLTLCVSTLFGLLFKDNFYITFAIATLLQFIGFYIFNSVYENILKRKAIELSTEFERERSKSTAVVNCPCGENNQQTISMILNNEKVYECSKCKKSIKAYANISTVLTTNPIYTKV